MANKHKKELEKIMEPVEKIMEPVEKMIVDLSVLHEKVVAIGEEIETQMTKVD